MEHKKKYQFRNFINDLHLWLGIGSGIILFLICLSGSILVFEKEIKGLFSEKIQLSGTDKPVKSLAQLKWEVETSGVGKLRSLIIPGEAGSFYEVQIKKSAGDRGGTTFFLNPYTAEIITPPASAADDFMFTILRLHRWLLFDTSIGRPIVGIATIIFLFLSFSGLILWFPKKWKWNCFKPALTIKTNAHWKRIIHDLHNTLGFYVAPFIIVIALTGLCWSFEGYRDTAEELLGAEIFARGRGQKPEVVPAGKPVRIETIFEIVRSQFPQKGEIEILFPTRRNPVYSIRKFGPSTFTPAMADRLILSSSGKLLSKDIFREKPLNEKIASLIKPIHTGHIFGTFSKVLYLLVCLVATSLPVTGTIIWINKLKKKQQLHQRR
ncbi:MAG: PepSY-associated TM helix domain-containing protein [Salinimicrobium sp.]